MSLRLNAPQPTTDSLMHPRSPSGRSRRRWGSKMSRRFSSGERGAAIIETALTLPLLLLVSVGIFEFGRAYQTWQILTNAACEGARVAILSNSTVSYVQSRVTAYMQSGLLREYVKATISIDQSQTVYVGCT